MKHKIEIAVTILLILFVPIMMYVNVGETKVNISIADGLLVLAALLFLVNIKEFFMERRWLYLLYFVGLLVSLFISQSMSMHNQAFDNVGTSVMLMEMIKTVIVAVYFFCAFIFIRNENSYRIVLQTISFSSIPVLLIGFSAYFYFLVEKEFPIETFQISGNLRFLGTFEDPNLAALYFIVVFFVSLANFQFAKNVAIRSAMLGICGLSLIAIFLTMSRGGWLALAVAIVVLFILNVKYLTKNSLMLVLPFIMLALLLVNLDLSLQDGKVTHTVVNRIQASLNSDIEDVDRVQLTKTAIEMGNDNFLFGVGKGSFPLNTYLYLGEDSPMYKNQYIPHNTLASFYAQQGIIGLLLFISLPGYILYRMIRSRERKNYFFIPLFIAIVVHSLTINIENVRFIWFLMGLLVVSELRGISLSAVQPAKLARRTFAIILTGLLLITLVLAVDLSRKLAANIYVANGDVYEKQVVVSEPGDYLLSFDVQTDGNRHHVDFYNGRTIEKSIEFEKAKGLVQLPIHIEDKAAVKFQSHEEGWMRINNAYLVKKENKTPLYNYLLLPAWAENWMSQHNWLIHLNVPSFKEELLVEKNQFDSLNLIDARLIRYGNFTSVFEFDMKLDKELEKDYQLELLMDYDSISDQYATESQRNHIKHRFTLSPRTSKWKEQESYTVKTNRLFSSEQFNLHGRYYDIEKQTFVQESYFPIDFIVSHENQEILPLGESHWINVRYGTDKQERINITNNGWVESGRMNFEPGSYEITFRAQGSYFNNEFSKLRLRDSSSLETITELSLDDTMKEYTVQFQTEKYLEGASFVLELINYEAEKDVGNRRVILEDWMLVEKVAK